MEPSNSNNNGREPYSDEQYTKWLDDMTPFLKLGNSLNYAIEKADLPKHKDTIYRKFRLKDWFCEKIEAFQRYPGEMVNSIFSRVIVSIDEKVKQGSPITDEEWRNLRFFAEKHRTCQQFFTTRTETAQTDDFKLGQILDRLEQENQKTDYALLGLHAKKAMEEMEQSIKSA